MHKHLTSSLLTLALLAGLASAAHAQAPGSGGPAPATPTAPTDTPIDGGASLLLAGGMAYAMRRLRARRTR